MADCCKMFTKAGEKTDNIKIENTTIITGKKDILKTHIWKQLTKHAIILTSSVNSLSFYWT